MSFMCDVFVWEVTRVTRWIFNIGDHLPVILANAVFWILAAWNLHIEQNIAVYLFLYVNY